MGGDNGERLSGELWRPAETACSARVFKVQKRMCVSSQCATILHSKGNENMITTMLAGDRLRRQLISLELLVLSQLRHMTRNQPRDREEGVPIHCGDHSIDESMTKCLPGP